MTDILVMQQVAKSFGGLTVFKDITLHVAQGERLGILGPNGAGKSTLFNLLSGLYPATSGTITYQDKPLRNLKPWNACASGIGRTFQIPQPFHAMSLTENLMVALTNGMGLSIKQARARAGDILQHTGLGANADQPAGSLTLLNLKRLELARAIAIQPKLLLLDEIAGGLTEAECDELLAILDEIITPDMTVIWIEHVIHALSHFASRVAVLADKRIVAQGTLNQVLAEPQVRSLYFGMEDQA